MKKLILTLCAVFLCSSLVLAQDKMEKKQTKEGLHIEVKEGAKPDIYVDGKKFDFPVELLDKDKIATINVLKGEKAMKEYNSENGVVLITTKKSDKEKEKFDYKEVEKEISQIPKVIIDGKESDRETLNKLSPDDIETIDVIKGEQAIKKHKAVNGVIIVKTKKGKKK